MSQPDIAYIYKYVQLTVLRTGVFNVPQRPIRQLVPVAVLLAFAAYAALYIISRTATLANAAGSSCCRHGIVKLSRAFMHELFLDRVGSTITCRLQQKSVEYTHGGWRSVPQGQAKRPGMVANRTLGLDPDPSLY